MDTVDHDDLASQARGVEDLEPLELRARFAAFLDELRNDLTHAAALGEAKKYRRLRTWIDVVREKARAASAELRP